MKKIIISGMLLIIILTGISENSVIGHEKIESCCNKEKQDIGELSNRELYLNHFIQANNQEKDGRLLTIASPMNASRLFDCTEIIGQKGPLLKIRGIITKINGEDIIAGGISYTIEVTKILEGAYTSWIVSVMTIV